ncbi:MAG: hypothetical protein RJA36_3733 [Pseudomonadota bacterium]|jgi:hypothetical protein
MSETRTTSGGLGGLEVQADGPAAALAGAAPPLAPIPTVTLDSAEGPAGRVEIVQPEGLAPEQAGSGSGAPPTDQPEAPAPLLGAETEPGQELAAPAEPAAQRRTRMVPGPLGGVAVPDDLEEVGGLLDLARRLRGTRPNPMGAPRPSDFVEQAGRTLMVREATTEEQEALANALGRPGGPSLRMVSTRGGYMPTDVQEFIGAVREANQTLFDEMRRGRMSREEMISIAEAIGLDGVVNRLLRRQPGETENAEGLIAGAVALVNVNAELRESAAALLLNPNAGPAELRRYGLNLALASALSGQLNGAAAEAGRALGALRFAGEALAMAPAEQLGGLAQRLGVVGQAGPDGLRVPRGASDEAIVDLLGGADVLRASAIAYNALPTPAARAQFASRSLRARTTDAIVAAWVNSLLWLPTTHIKNVLGNGTMGLWQVPERLLAGAIGGVRTTMGVGSDERVYMGEAFAQLYGMYSAMGDALAASGQTWRTNIPVGGSGKIELPRPNPISAEAFELSGAPGRALDLLGTGMTLPGRTLITTDAFFQTMAYRAELHAQALRYRNQLVEQGVDIAKAAEEAARFYENPPEAWRDAAEAFSRSVVFQQELGPGMQMVGRAMQHPLAKVIVPFFTTPTNIVRAVLHRTPVAALSPAVWGDILAGGARADLALSRMALGSMAMWWMYGQVVDSSFREDFRITGAEPSQAARRDSFRRQGLQPYSICHRTEGGWSCTSYQALDPISGLLAMAADTATYVLDHPNVDGDEAGMRLSLESFVAGGVTGLYQYMLESPFLQGVSDLTRIMSDARLEPGERTTRMVQQLTRQGANALIGAQPLPLTGGPFSGALERAIDPTVRESRLQDRDWMQANPVTRGFAEAFTAARARSPLASGDLPAVLNLWAEPVQPTAGGAWELFWPFRTTRPGVSDRLEQELLRLGGVLQMPRRQFPGTTVELTPAQYNRLLEDMNSAEVGGGMTMREEMEQIIELPGWDGMDPADQLAALRQVRDRRWTAAQRLSLGADDDLARRVERDRDFRRVMGRSPARGAFDE